MRAHGLLAVVLKKIGKGLVFHRADEQMSAVEGAAVYKIAHAGILRWAVSCPVFLFTRVTKT